MDQSATISRSVSRYTWIAHVCFWLILFILPFTATLQTEHWTVAFSWSIIPVAFQIGAAYLNIRVLIPRLFKRRRFLLYALSVLAVLMLVPLVMNLWADAMFDREALANRFFERRGNEDFNIPTAFKYIPPILVTVVVMFISSSYALARDFMRKERNQVMLEKEKTAAELKALRSQMNPHFVFNALNNLNAVTKLAPERTELFIERLSEMMRYVIGPEHTDGVSLESELKFIESYLFFQKEKDPDHINIDFEHDIDDQSRLIEPMLIIPLLENAFKHGYSLDNEVLNLTIHFSHQKGKTVVVVKNSLPSNEADFVHDPARSGIGLHNIKQRLQYRYPDRHEINTTSNDTHFTVKIEVSHGQ